MQKGNIINLHELIQRQSNGNCFSSEFGHGDVIAMRLEWQPNATPGPLQKGIYINAFTYILITGGDATFLVDGVEYTVEQCDLFIFSPLHLIKLQKGNIGFTCLILGITKQFIDKLLIENIQNRIVRGMSMHHSPIVHIHQSDADTIGKCIINVHEQLRRTTHPYQLELVRNAINRFNIETDAVLLHPADNDRWRKSTPLSRQGEILRQFRSLLFENYKVKHDVAFYAEKMNLSSQYLTSVIKQQAGRTVSDFINEMLYSAARNLLVQQEFSIQQIAEEIGYSDQASFSKAFKRLSGMSPQRYRHHLTEMIKR